VKPVTLTPGTDADWLYDMLADGEPHTLNEILHRSFKERGCGLTVHSRVSDLRVRHGLQVRHSVTSGRRGNASVYQLVVPLAETPSPCPEPVAPQEGVSASGPLDGVPITSADGFPRPLSIHNAGVGTPSSEPARNSGGTEVSLSARSEDNCSGGSLDISDPVPRAAIPNAPGDGAAASLPDADPVAATGSEQPALFDLPNQRKEPAWR